MITLRLYRESDPGRQIDSYIMGDGDVTVGRDPKAVWVIDDPNLRLSRFHCTISAREGRVSVRDTSANGVFIVGSQTRMDRATETIIPAGERLQIGDFLVQVDVERECEDDRAHVSALRMHEAPMSDEACVGSTSAIRNGWPDPERPAPPRPASAASAGEVVMLEAFCEGAELDPAFLTKEDPIELMRRLGEIYQQVVLGLGELMSERASMKAEYSLERTTISAADNNLLKWAPTHRLAIDLICERTDGFLKGSEAIKECFEDLRGHSLCLVSGSRAAVTSVLEHLDPKAIEAEGKPKAALFIERSEVAWRRLKSLHADLSNDPFNDPESAISRAFKYGYEQRAGELNAKEPVE